MEHYLDRRQFLMTSAYAATGFALGMAQNSWAKDPFKHTLHKALVIDKPTEEMLKRIKDAGFEGVEAGIISPTEAAKAREIAEKLGMRIHSVLRGWAKFNSNSVDEVESSLATTVDALGAAQGYGADAVLLVPGRISGRISPKPWEFHVRFDEKTGHLTAVVEKDNDRYRDYMAAHDHAYDTFQVAIRKLIPIAQKMGVVIAIENVWNNLFVDPRHMVYFIDSFNSLWVQSYFDIGNHVKYSPPEKWIAILGKRIVKCHVKDFKLNPDGHGGSFVNIRDGSVNWPAVRKALDDINYDGWMTIEGSGKLSIDERNKRLDLIVAGK